MARGGARVGAGAKKGQHRIHVGELRSAIEAKIGMPYQEMLAMTQLKLFNHFNQSTPEFVKEYLAFTENMSRRIIQEQEINIESDTMSKEEIDDRINNLLTRKVLSEPNNDSIDKPSN